MDRHGGAYSPLHHHDAVVVAFGAQQVRCKKNEDAPKSVAFLLRKIENMTCRPYPPAHAQKTHVDSEEKLGRHSTTNLSPRGNDNDAALGPTNQREMPFGKLRRNEVRLCS